MRYKKKVFFLGGLMTDELVDYCIKNDISYDMAANNFQKKFIKGLPSDTIYINTPFIFYNSNYKMNYASIEQNGRVIKCKRYFNYKYINNIMKYFTLISIINNIDFTDSVLICYAIHSPFLKLITRIKRRYNVKVVQIVPDLPQYMNMDSHVSNLYRLLKYMDTIQIEKMLQNVDLFVPFTLNMYTDYLHRFCNQYYVMEGIYSDEQYTPNCSFKKEIKKRIVYTGSLNIKYGVKKIIDAFSYLDEEEYELVICGEGELSNQLRSTSYTNIVYLGVLSPNNVKSLMYSADLLINPREDSFQFTKYSCPSKLFEYLSTGKEILCFKLSGVPNEYDKFLHFFSSNTPKEMANDIRLVLKQGINKNNSENFLKSKTAHNHVKKILNIICQ